jgi:hypothetical protein
MSDNVQRSFGLIQDPAIENRASLMEHGMDPEQALRLMRSTYPDHNPEAEPFTTQQYQGNQGACAGHAIAHKVQTLVTLVFGIQLFFSRANAYYEAQRKSGISGDRGSTLSGCQQVISVDGICLEKDWVYPNSYNNTRPAGWSTAPRVWLKSSQPTRDPELIFDLAQAGAAIQTGLGWTNSMERGIVDSYTTSGNVGGHSTMVYGIMDGDLVNHNSWRNWQANSPAGPGRQRITKNAVKDIVQRDRYAEFVAYLPVGVVVDPAILKSVSI